MTAASVAAALVSKRIFELFLFFKHERSSLQTLKCPILEYLTSYKKNGKKWTTFSPSSKVKMNLESSEV